jgi:hypothetical protein
MASRGIGSHDDRNALHQTQQTHWNQQAAVRHAGRKAAQRTRQLDEQGSSKGPSEEGFADGGPSVTGPARTARGPANAPTGFTAAS